MQETMRMRTAVRFAGVLFVAAAAASCGDVVRQGRSPSMLVVDSLQGSPGGGHGANTFTGTLFSDVIVLVTTPAPCTPDSPCPTVFADSGQATLSIALKDVTVSPTSNNQVTITRYTVTYRRNDGRNTPGVDVPYPFDGAVTATIQPNQPTTVAFELVRHVAKEEAPLVQLIANPNIITTIADVTFYGRDQVGNDVTVTGSMVIEFGNFGDQ
jgi:hypothetical protein